MADQEFLASFAVKIDESGVSRLQQIRCWRRNCTIPRMVLAEDLTGRDGIEKSTGGPLRENCFPEQ